MFDSISNAIYAIDDVIWGWWLIILLFGTHIFMTIRTGVIQRKTLSKGLKLSVTKDPDAEGEVSNFGALTTALAATIGTGNIVGVGTAIALGGPGAVLWCWLSGVFGIATKYSESLIAVKYRVKTKDGRMQGGAMYALSRGLKWQPFGKILGLIFAIFAGFASFGIGCATQVNAIANIVEENVGVPGWVVGVVCAVLTAIVIFGGIKSIANVCEKLVPFMAIFYVLGCIIILGINYDYIIPRSRRSAGWPSHPAQRLAVLLEPVSGRLCSTELPEDFSPMSPVWVLPPSRQRRRRRGTRCARRLYPPQVHSGIQLLCV